MKTAEEYFEEGVEFQQQDNREKAIESYEKCVTINPRYEKAYNNLGLCYRKKDPSKAVEYYKKATDLNGAFYEAFIGWGNVLSDLNEDHEAREKFRKAIEIDPGKKQGHYKLGMSYAKNDASKAITCYQKAIDIDPNDKYIFNAWGNVLADMELDDEARVKYERCLEIDPAYNSAYYNLGILFAKKDPEKAINYYRTAIGNDPDYADAWLGWGNVLLDRDQDNEAREKYEKCLEIDPKYKDAYFNLGISYQKDDPLKGIEYFKKAIEQDPDYADAFNALYTCISNVGDNAGLIRDFEKFAEEKNSAAAYAALGHLYNYVLGDYEKGLLYYDECKERGGIKNIAFDISTAYQSMGNIEKSLEVINEALITEPGNLYALHNKAHYLFQLGKYKASRDQWQIVLDKYEERFKSDLAFRNDPNNYLYCGSIYNEIFGDFEKAIIKYEAGLRKNRKDLRFLAILYQVYSEMDKRTINPEISQFWRRNSYLQEAEKLFEESIKIENYYYLMAENYIAAEMYDEAQGMITNCLKDHKANARTYILQGQIHTALEEYQKAIAAFKNALRFEGANLTIRINLGNVYIRNKNYPDAELELNRVLQRDPNNIEALTGLGEINLNRAEENSDTELLETAEKYLLDAVRLGKSENGSVRLNLYEPVNKKMKRKYKDLKLSELYYSLGYIKTMQFEKNRFGFNNTYLNEGLQYFTRSCECNPDNLKAGFATKKILKNVRTRKHASRMENLGSWLVSGMALLLFIFCQYFFFLGCGNSKIYILTPENAKYITTLLEKKRDSSATGINKLAGVKFIDKNTLMKSVEDAVGSRITASKMALISEMDFSSTKEKPANEFLPVGYYVMISFGSIIFLIAGLYLPKLLKLKVGVIEIEKNSPSEINNMPMLGIKK